MSKPDNAGMNIDDHPFIKAVQELHAFNLASFADLERCEKALKQTPGDLFWRRTAVRIFAAHVEGIVFLMKQSILLLAPYVKVNFTEGEIAFLKEVSFELNEKGEVEERGGKWPKFISNFRFTCSCFCRVNRSTLVLKYDDHGFERFREMVKIRDRLTHPKSKDALLITDAEEKTVREAWHWFQNHFATMTKDCMKSFTAYAQNLVKSKT